MDISFPRGGTRTTSKSSKKRDGNEDLFNATPENVKDKPKKKKKIKKVTDDGDEDREMVIIDRLTAKNLSEGMVVLGAVSEVRQYQVLFSLPGGIMASLPITNMPESYVTLLRDFAENPEEFSTKISPLNMLFNVGNCYPVKVLDRSAVEGSFVYKFTVTLNPKAINEDIEPLSIYNGMVLLCAVSSCQDHGYIVDAGIPGLTGFLSNKDATYFIQSWNHGNPLAVGQPLLLAVKMPELDEEPLEARTIIFTTDSKLLENQPTSFDNITLQNIIPGVQLPADVIEVDRNGLALKCLGYNGCVWHDNLKSVFDTTEKFNVADEILGTVLFVHPLTKVIHMTLVSKSTFKNVKSRFGNLSKGDIIEDAEVIEAQHFGVYFRLNENVKGFAKASHLSDKQVTQVKDAFLLGQKFRCRVMGLDYVDKIVKVSLKHSILSQVIVSNKNLKVGDVLKGIVEKHTPDGMVVKLSHMIRGFARSMFLSDVPLKHPEKIYPVDSEVQCRILSLDKEGRSHLITCQKSLVRSKIPPALNYEDIKQEDIIEGAIVLVSETGLLVSFYNSVRGWVKRSEMSTEFIENPEDIFYKGQVVKCSVLQVDPITNKMSLSLKLMALNPFGTKYMSKGIKVGEICSVRVISKDDDGLSVQVEPDGANAFLPTMHLSDHPYMCKLIYNAFNVNDIIEVVAFTTKGTFIVTKKKIFLHAAAKGTMITKPEDLEKGKIVPGVVKGFMDYGLSIEVGGKLFGLAHRWNLSDTLTASEHITSLNLATQQSLFVKVLKADLEKKRYWFSCKLSKVISLKKPWASALNHLESYLNEWDFLVNRDVEFSKLQVGSLTQVTITDSDKDSIFCKLHFPKTSGKKNPVKISGIVNKHNVGQAKVEIGNQTDAIILHMDVVNNNVEFSLDPTQIRLAKENLANPLKLTPGDKVTAKVVVIKHHFALSILVDSGILVYLPVKRHINDTVGLILAVGDVINVVIKRVKDDHVIGLHNYTQPIERSVCEFVSKTTELDNEVKERNLQKLESVMNSLKNQIKERKLKAELAAQSKNEKSISKPAKSVSVDLEEPKNVPEAETATKFVAKKRKKPKKIPGNSLENATESVNIGEQKKESEMTQKLPVKSGKTQKKIKIDGHSLENATKNIKIVGEQEKSEVTQKLPVKRGKTPKKMKIDGNSSENDSIRVKLVEECKESEMVEKLSVLSGKTPNKVIMDRNSLESMASSIKLNGKGPKKDTQIVYDVEDDDDTTITKKRKIVEKVTNDSLKLARYEDELNVDKMGLEETSLKVPKVLNVSMLEKRSKPNLNVLTPKMVEKIKRSPEKKKSLKQETLKNSLDVSSTLQNALGVPVYDVASVSQNSKPSLNVNEPFIWDVDATPNLSQLAHQKYVSSSSEDENSEDDKDKEDQGKRKSKQSIIAKKKDDEDRLRRQEEKLMDLDREPEGSDDYERLLLASPNSSLIWMKFMAFQLQQAEIEKARAIGERALKVISFREEKEKLNVWIALLNLENMYGTQESLTTLFARAVQANDPLSVYRHMVGIYVKSDKNQEAEQLFHTMLKKFRQEQTVWIDFGIFYFKTGQLELARNIMDKSLQSLEKRLHIDVISKFAQLEFQFGDAERGKNLFKNILNNFPKRIDLWSVFIDILIKQGEQESARQTLERLVTMSLPAKKMKFVFKKFMEFEKEHGDEGSMEKLRKKALEYVESAAGNEKI